MSKYLVVDHDEHPDLSYLEQAEFSDTDPSTIVSLLVVAYDEHACPECGQTHRNIVDALGGVDFERSSSEWATGRFNSVEELPEGYLRDVWKNLIGEPATADNGRATLASAIVLTAIAAIGATFVGSWVAQAAAMLGGVG